ncbi:hypothetical protein M413DRAFT_308507 [Hebeloma cylindrosporum]|uniref:Uncharacterized protein n=1 Tax=Hebeloma cylindrosporum TaxID=76867 RepID=A0A0C3CQ70_HEBCY|nr:hypothetical protein M413DRAFT_308507 [Hebeloma cylindrosporum h7]
MLDSVVLTMYRQPFIQILALRQLHSQPQITRSLKRIKQWPRRTFSAGIAWCLQEHPFGA